MISLSGEGGDHSPTKGANSAPIENGEAEAARGEDGADDSAEAKVRCDGAKLEEEQENSVLEAQKAFQRIANQLSLQPSPQQPRPNGVNEANARSLPPHSAAATATMSTPFLLRQRLDSLSPFLAALHQQQIQQQLLYGNLPGVAQLAMMANIGAAAASMLPTPNGVSDGRSRGESNASAASSTGGGELSPDATGRPVGTQHNATGDNEEDVGFEDAVGEYCEARTGCGQPEDLSIGCSTFSRDMRPRRQRENGGSPQAANSNNGWSYEEQFKQLYELSDDRRRRLWLDDWFAFMHQIGKPVTRIPIMAKQILDLYELYRLVVQHGGLVEIINKKLWREITKGLNLPNSITSAAFTLRTQYQKYLYDYECDRHNLSRPEELQAAIDGNRRESRRAHPSNHHQATTAADASRASNASTPSPLDNAGDVAVNLVASGNGRRHASSHVVGGVHQTRAPPLHFPLPMAPSSVAAALLGVGNGGGLAAGSDPLKSSISHNHHGGSVASLQLTSSSSSLGAAKFNCPLEVLMQQKQLELFQRAALEAIDNGMRAAVAETRADNAEQNGMLIAAAATSTANGTASRKRKTGVDSAREGGTTGTGTSLPTHRLKIATGAPPTGGRHGCANSITVSMEVDGTTYEGVLFAASRNEVAETPQSAIPLANDKEPTGAVNGKDQVAESLSLKRQPKEAQNEDT